MGIDTPPSTWQASDWVRRWSHLLVPGSPVLDVACGQGRHMRWFASRGHPVAGVDRSPEALESLSDLEVEGCAELVCCDIESGPWPFFDGTKPRHFGGVVVTNYLWRPLFPVLLGSLAPDGVLLYETFVQGNASVGKPSRPDFLLEHGELLSVCAGLRIVAYEDGFCESPARFVQRIAGVRLSTPQAGHNATAPVRHVL